MKNLKISLAKPLVEQLQVTFEEVLRTQPSPDNNYMSRMRKLKPRKTLIYFTEKFSDFMAKHYHVSALTGAAKLVGQDIGEKMNPICYTRFNASSY